MVCPCIIEFVAGFLNHGPCWCARILQGNLLFWRFVLPCSDVRGHFIYRLLNGKKGQMKKELPSVAMMNNLGFGQTKVWPIHLLMHFHIRISSGCTTSLMMWYEQRIKTLKVCNLSFLHCFNQSSFFFLFVHLQINQFQILKFVCLFWKCQHMFRNTCYWYQVINSLWWINLNKKFLKLGDSQPGIYNYQIGNDTTCTVLYNCSS